MSAPKVSIIISFYNSENTLQRCLAGVLQQTYRELEVILIDDGSGDAGSRICQYYASQDPRVQVIRKRNSGVSDSRNVGLERATGDWVYFADADDWLAPWAIETLVAAVQDSGCDMAVSDFYRVRGSYIARKQGPTVGKLSQEEYVQYMSERPANFYYASLWNKLFKRSILEDHNLRFNTKISFGEDHIFILDYLRLVDNIMLVDEPLYYYVDNAGSLMHQGLTPASVVKNKWKVYQPYMRLFKELGLNTTAKEKSKIYRFLFWPATDGLVKTGAEPLDASRIPG